MEEFRIKRYYFKGAEKDGLKVPQGIYSYFALIKKIHLFINQNLARVLSGKYFLVDAGYGNTTSYIASY